MNEVSNGKEAGMSNPLERNENVCGCFRDELENAASQFPGASTVEDLLAVLSPDGRTHLLSCNKCRTAVDDLIAIRVLLSPLPAYSKTEAPWFASRVMADIAAQEDELSRSTTAWSIVPRFAARLAWATAFLLLLTSTWFYKQPATQSSNEGISGSSAESLFDAAGAMPHDDLLVNNIERE